MEHIAELFEKIKECIAPEMDMRQMLMLRTMSEELFFQVRSMCYERQEALTRSVTFLKDVDAHNTFTYGQCGDQLFWKIKDDVLYIGGEGPMWDFGLPFYGKNLAPWYHHDFSEIMMMEGVTSIGTYAFAEADISSVHIPSSLERIGAGAFFEAYISVLNLPGTLHTIEQDIIAADPCQVSKLIVSCDIPNIAWEAFYTRYLAPNEIVLTGSRPESLDNLIHSHLFRFIPHRLWYPQSWDTEEQSFCEFLREGLDEEGECWAELSYDESSFDKLRKVMAPYSGDPQ